MKFYDRENELKLLDRFGKSSGFRFVIVNGLRRIGKTSLIQKWLNGRNSLYVFVPKDKTISLFLEETCSELNLPRFNSMHDFLKYIFEKYEYVFFDEFQNFSYIDKSVYSLFQNMVDSLSNDKRNVCLFVTGSSYSLMKKIFSDYSKALYGRKDVEIRLMELDVMTVMDILSDLGIKPIEDRIRFWALFGGMPRLYVLLEKLGITSFKDFEGVFLSANIRTMLSEGRAILVSEFGGEYKTYYSIMEAIAGGKTNLSEIASVFENDVIATNRYIDLLRNEYELIAKKSPLTLGIGAKKGNYYIRNNFLKFWFRFVKRYESYYEQNRIDEIARAYKEGFDTYMGRAFEDFCISLLRKGYLFKAFPLLEVGGEWGSFKGEKGKNSFEIDIVGLNGLEKKILFCECKWSEGVDADAVIKELKEKSGHVAWEKEVRKEYYVVIARSFKRKIKSDNIICFDLDDIEKAMK